MQQGFHCSESIVLFHLVFWMSFLRFLVVCFGACLFLLFEDIRLFAFRLFSCKLRIVVRLQNVDDVRASSARNGRKTKPYAGLYTFSLFNSQVFPLFIILFPRLLSGPLMSTLCASGLQLPLIRVSLFCLPLLLFHITTLGHLFGNIIPHCSFCSFTFSLCSVYPISPQQCFACLSTIPSSSFKRFLRSMSFFMVQCILGYCPRAGHCFCRHLRAASGIALPPLPGWASPWLPFALFYAVLASPSQDKLRGL